MEVRTKKINSITWKMITGIVIFLGINSLLLPNYYVWDAYTNLMLSLLSVFGYVLFAKAIYELYEDNPKSDITRFQIIAGIGLIAYCLFTIFWIIASLGLSVKVNDYVYALGGWSIKAHPGPLYVWCMDVHKYVAYFIIGYRALTFLLLIPAMNAAVCDSFINYKRFKIVKWINFVWIIVVIYLLFNSSTHKLSTLDDREISLVFVVFTVYIISLVAYILYIRKFLNISSERKNGSIFNRIPEEEYQEFLNKMK